ncbi:hypothetical protein DERF_008153 [Dermatophagoides farinae]|uniref:Uncharacterized protein n=1 Tax=Dermatophagoides farinae TaxID=6954 RepID=A0A922L575_DERFA|nr:hypothetical protein DERF_008153 [Dermatophagoides farinae]
MAEWFSKALANRNTLDIYDMVPNQCPIQWADIDEYPGETPDSLGRMYRRRSNSSSVMMHPKMC